MPLRQDCYLPVSPAAVNNGLVAQLTNVAARNGYVASLLEQFRLTNCYFSYSHLTHSLALYCRPGSMTSCYILQIILPVFIIIVDLHPSYFNLVCICLTSATELSHQQPLVDVIAVSSAFQLKYEILVFCLCVVTCLNSTAGC
jgi:hypothetical protein